MPPPVRKRIADGASPENVVRARKLLDQARTMRDLLGLDHARLQRTGEDEAQIAASTNLGEDRLTVAEPEAPASAPDYRPYLVWLPEGLAFTPRSVSRAVHGWGMPRRDAEGGLINPPFGTAFNGSDPNEGALKEVLVNRYRDNRYADVPEAPLGYENWERVQDQKGNKQFVRRFVPGYSEVERDTWYCHWPQEGRYLPAVLRTIQTQTNAVRAEAGVPRLTGPVRGYDAFLPQASVKQVRASHVLAHNSTAFQAGYQWFTQRQAKDGTPTAAGENLAFMSNDAARNLDSEALGIAFVAIWEESPEHQENLVRDWTYGAPNVSTELQLALGTGSIEAREVPPYVGEAEAVPSQSGRIATQDFVARERWLWYGNVDWQGEAGRLSWWSPRPFRYACISAGTAADNLKPWVALWGRKIGLPAHVLVLGAALARDEDERLWLRVAAFEDDTVVLYRAGFPLTLDPEDGAVVLETLQSYDPGAGLLRIGHALFSQDGLRCVFSVVEQADTLSDYLAWNQRDWSQVTGDGGHPRAWTFMRHIVLDDLGYEEVASAEPMIQVLADTTRGGGRWVNRYTAQCYGNLPAYADWVDSALVWARVECALDYVAEVDMADSGEDFWADQPLYEDVQATTNRLDWTNDLVLPDGSRVHLWAWHLDESLTREDDPSFFTELVHLDLRNPGDLAYQRVDVRARQDLDTIPEAWGLVRTEGERRLYVQGQLVEQTGTVARSSPVQYLSAGRIPAAGMALMHLEMPDVWAKGSDAALFSAPTATAYYVAYDGGNTLFQGFECDGTDAYNRTLVPRQAYGFDLGRPLLDGCRDPELNGVPLLPYHQTSWTYSPLYHESYGHLVSYRGEWVYWQYQPAFLAIDTTGLGATVGERKRAWQQQSVRASSLDLAALTGIDDLDAYIGPIGVVG